MFKEQQSAAGELASVVAPCESLLSIKTVMHSGSLKGSFAFSADEQFIL